MKVTSEMIARAMAGTVCACDATVRFTELSPVEAASALCVIDADAENAEP